MNSALLLSIALSVAASVWFLWRQLNRRHSVQLINASVEADSRSSPPLAAGYLSGRLARWLNLAGYRRKQASANFQIALAASTALASGLVILVRQSGMLDLLRGGLSYIPGGIGDLAQAIISLTNWIVFIGVAAIPILVVRARRRQRVEQIEQDLPLFLELLATLAEAGLGFEAGLARIGDAETAQRPLYMEFQFYQRDMLAGLSRVQALRNLVRRMEVNSITVFVSALIQAEQVGASIAVTLRRQAEDLRDRRKMRALLQSQALTVKLVFPLVLCFLPGIFVSTLGPVINQMIKVADSVLRNAR